MTAPGATQRPDVRPSVELAAVSKWFGDVVAVSEVSFALWPGVTALLGPNGAGKSTLVLAVGGVLRPTAGTIKLGDADLTRRRPEQVRQAGVAVVPEGRRLLPDLTVADERQPDEQEERQRQHFHRRVTMDEAADRFG